MQTRLYLAQETIESSAFCIASLLTQDVRLAGEAGNLADYTDWKAENQIGKNKSVS
jgi:hypothetical protein